MDDLLKSYLEILEARIGKAITPEIKEMHERAWKRALSQCAPFIRNYKALIPVAKYLDDHDPAELHAFIADSPRMWFDHDKARAMGATTASIGPLETVYPGRLPRWWSHTHIPLADGEPCWLPTPTRQYEELQ